MMNSQVKAVARFLRQEQHAKSVRKYKLRFAGKGRNGHPVEEFEIVEALDMDDLDRLAESIYDRAQMDADGMGPTPSPYRYTLTSVIGEGEEEKESARVPFRVRANADLDIDGEEESGEESPNMRGLLGQLMRHNEANNRTLVGGFSAFMAAAAKREEQQAEMIERLLNERSDMISAIEEVETRRTERQLQLESERAKQSRIDFGIKRLAMLAPTALSYLTDGKAGKAGLGPAETMVLKELIASVTPEQMQSIASTLKPEQAIAFFRLYEAMKEKGNESGEETPPVS